MYRVARAKKKREYQMELHQEAELWRGVKEATRHWNTVGEMPLENRVIVSKVEALMQIYIMTGRSFRLRDKELMRTLGRGVSFRNTWNR